MIFFDILMHKKIFYQTGINKEKMESIINEPKPHFYEYMEIQLLQSYIQRGIGYFINSIANSSDRLVWLRYYSDEIGFGVDLLKDIVCLVKYSATYAQQFYGLQRRSLSSQHLSSPTLPKPLLILYHALTTTLIPYLLNKIDKHYNNFIEQQQNQGRQLTGLETIFTKMYPYLHLVVSVVQTLMRFRYLLVKEERVFDLYYKLSKTTLGYKQKRLMPGEEGRTHYPWMDLVKTPGLLAIILGHKVLSWYFTQKNQRNNSDNNNKKLNSIDKYMSPLQTMNSQQGGEMKKKEFAKGLCLICGKGISNPTVVRQNGRVYCYGCISDYVRQNGKCPVTNFKISQQSLQLVYYSSH